MILLSPTRDRRNCLLAVISILFFFAGLEVVLALFWPHKVAVHPYHELYHPVMGWVNKPYVSGRVKVFGAGNLSFERTHNNLGLRSLRSAAYEKRAGIRRILLLGDSFFWGYGVDDKDVVSEILQERVGSGIEVINGAVMGYATDQELLWLVEEGLKYRPDLVILGAFPANDLDDIGVSIMMGYPKPFFSLQNGQLSLENVPVPDTRETRRKAFEEPDTFFGKLKKVLRHHTHTYPFLAGRLNSIPSLRRFFLRIGMAEEFSRDFPGISLIRLKDEYIPGLFNALVKEIKRVSGEAGADFLLVHIPRKEQPSPGKRSADAPPPGEAYAANTEASAYLAKFARLNQIQFLDLLPMVRGRRMPEERLYVPEDYDHHWTPQGHRAAAEALFQWVKAKGWLRTKTKTPAPAESSR